MPNRALSTSPERHLAGICELHEPRKSCMFVKTSLWTDDRSEGSEPVSSRGRRMLAVELTKPFLLAEFVELGGDDGGGLLVGGPGELGVELQGRRAFRVAEAPGDGVQVGTCGQKLGGGVVP